MSSSLRWEADPTLSALLQRYYQGEAALWPEIQAHVHSELAARKQPLGPRHLRFRRTVQGYEVIIEPADAYLRS
jgi:hypothetical protein